MKTLSLLLALAFVLHAQPSAAILLHEGTPIRMKINRTISSAEATVGENIDFQTLDDIRVGSEVVIPQGSTAIGTVTEAKAKGHMGKGGKLDVNIDYVRMPDGSKLPLRGVQDVKGGGHTGAMTGAMVATSVVFFPAAPLFLFMKGKDITIPQRPRGDGLHEYGIPYPCDFPAECQPVGSTSGCRVRYANSDVMKLKAAGLGDELIIQRVKLSPGNYSLSPDDLATLKKAGVSDAVIGAMLSAHTAAR